ncbi:type VII secretion integral membrane protein EccD [Mycolicibacterium sp. CBM1]
MTELSATIDSAAVLPIVRVAILADSRVVDMALPARLPLREILPAVCRLLPPAPVADGAATPAAPRPVSLALIGGAPFSTDASLETVGVVDGDLLALQTIPVGPSATGLVEDVADAAVIYSAARLRPWGIRNIRLIARAAVVTVILAATVLSATYRATTGGVAGLYTVGALAAATIVATLLARARAEHVATELSVVALAPIATALALAVSNDLSAPSVMLAAAGVSAWSLTCMIVLDRLVAFFAGSAVVGTAILTAAAVAQIWHLPVRTLGCGLLAAALLIAVRSPQLAAVTARLPLPVIPAPGDPAPTAPAIDVLADLPRRVRTAQAHQLGFLAGAVVLSVVGSLAGLSPLDTAGGWVWYAVVATAVAAVLRARIWDSVPNKTWLLLQPFLVSVALLGIFITMRQYLAASCVLAVLAALAGAFVGLSLSPKQAAPQSYSLPIRRVVGMLAVAVDASLLPVLAYVVGLFGWVLQR